MDGGSQASRPAPAGFAILRTVNQWGRDHITRTEMNRQLAIVILPSGILTSVLHIFSVIMDGAVDICQRLRTNQEPESGREYTMYHGTHKSKARGIITAGFERSLDGLLGPGIYVSRDKKKALCYPLNASDHDRVVLTLRVKVGKVKKIDCDNHPMQKTWHLNGYDTAWVPPNSNITTIRSGREEDCVWDPARITIIDVSHCEDPETRERLRDLITEVNQRSRLGRPDIMPRGTVINIPHFPTVYTLFKFILTVMPFYLRDCAYALYISFSILDLFFQFICAEHGVHLKVLLLNLLAIYFWMWIILNNTFFLMFLCLVVFVVVRLKIFNFL
ncbi:hypothetical protein NDU88_006101 [Pleurodeles waltl]|uniref:PARP catalytic domain-containing protein n=1 Tax=Pleurodeles waltl TaxID=8319 RepID=A0AAV7UNN3_PLEWA|nr:hypothetical protein NDU88_006101 [Pleurodeles waltl]